MRNLFFTLAFMLIGSFAFANANEIANSNLSVIDNSEIRINEQDINLNNFELDTLIFDCTITIKDNQTGKSYTITVHGQSCGDLIKELME